MTTFTEDEKVNKKWIQAVIAYCSPAGTTRHVAEVIKKRLAEDGIAAVMVDLTGKNGKNFCFSSDKEKRRILFVGSPVYCGHAVFPVTAFINVIAEGSVNYAVPFVTYGGVTSGVAISEMATAFQEKGIPIIGAAKIASEHSMMWELDEPLCKGRPNVEDDQLIESLVDNVLRKMRDGTDATVPLSELMYQPEEVYEFHKMFNLVVAKTMVPKRTVDENSCVECHACADVCPTKAISYTPFPEFGDDCICCYNCVKKCPENAIHVDMSPAHTFIRQHALRFGGEKASSEILV